GRVHADESGHLRAGVGHGRQPHRLQPPLPLRGAHRHHDSAVRRGAERRGLREVRLGAVALAISLTVLPSCGGSTVSYPLHTGITATVFWIGEPQGNGSSENNALSAWDDRWLEHYGGIDDPDPVRLAANDYFPTAFTPRENPFYADLPYDDFDGRGRPSRGRMGVVPWARRYGAELAAATSRGDPFSLLKNRWLKLLRAGRVCYAQW